VEDQGVLLDQMELPLVVHLMIEVEVEVLEVLENLMAQRQDLIVQVL
tara:strand:- start:562 stop:702 length:141 start_codon:yes stop_codon:yes gene_type:complete